MPRKRALVEEEDEGNTSPVEEVAVKAVFDEEGHRARDTLNPAPQLADGAISLKIVSWNVNGLRSLATTNKATLLNVIKEQKPDILCLQVLEPRPFHKRYCHSTKQVSSYCESLPGN